MTSDEVNEAMVAACQRLGDGYTRRQWQREMAAVEAMYEQLSEDEKGFVDLEPIVMMDPRLRG